MNTALTAFSASCGAVVLSVVAYAAGRYAVTSNYPDPNKQLIVGRYQFHSLGGASTMFDSVTGDMYAALPDSKNSKQLQWKIILLGPEWEEVADSTPTPKAGDVPSVTDRTNYDSREEVTKLLREIETLAQNPPANSNPTAVPFTAPDMNRLKQALQAGQITEWELDAIIGATFDAYKAQEDDPTKDGKR
jgi:hypothetical protein